MSRWLPLFVLLFAFGCGGGESSAPAVAGDAPAEAPAAEPAPAEPPPEAGPAGDPELETVIAVARKVRANPDQAATLLAEAGYTVYGFSELLVEIASDPARSEAYAAGLE
jgi:ABC-type transport system substrate-binding protein